MEIMAVEWKVERELGKSGMSAKKKWVKSKVKKVRFEFEIRTINGITEESQVSDFLSSNTSFLVKRMQLEYWKVSTVQLFQKARRASSMEIVNMSVKLFGDLEKFFMSMEKFQQSVNTRKIITRFSKSVRMCRIENKIMTIEWESVKFF